MKINEDCQLIVNKNSKRNKDLIFPQSEKEKYLSQKKLKTAFIFVLFFFTFPHFYIDIFYIQN